ncbi:formate/nitrite transporter family protein [Flavisphingomonas formosensis]|uniref:formate/nitrite transporter family protein n=1 Tax=Flavisphingomonas formosensis TaxID=861534 RepID=UPI0012FA4859|nr:formate/nitrite transporter family protein [Sphingomonas formosensis]
MEKDASSTEETGEHRPDAALTRHERHDVDERRARSPKVLHEVVRLQGEEELARPLSALLLSGLAAGFAMTLSLLSELFLRMRLPDTNWAPLIYMLGYPVGYLIVIMGRLQLFTETTVTAVLPVARAPTAANLGRLMRLWCSVLSANLVGVSLISALMAAEVIVSHEQRIAAIDILQKLEVQDGLHTLTLGIPAGFLMASIAWLLPNARGSEFWVIGLLTYVIAIGGFSHVVTGTSQASFLWLSGRMSLSEALIEFTLPALAGNIIGGTGLFAVLAHGQIRGDIASSK